MPRAQRKYLSAPIRHMRGRSRLRTRSPSFTSTRCERIYNDLLVSIRVSISTVVYNTNTPSIVIELGEEKSMQQSGGSCCFKVDLRRESNFGGQRGRSRVRSNTGRAHSPPTGQSLFANPIVSHRVPSTPCPKCREPDSEVPMEETDLSWRVISKC